MTTLYYQNVWTLNGTNTACPSINIQLKWQTDYLMADPWATYQTGNAGWYNDSAGHCYISLDYPIGDPAPVPAIRLGELITARVAPAIITRHKPIPSTHELREQRARETLRTIIGEQKYRNYLRTGSVSVRAKSGLTYQIFPGHGITRVFDKSHELDRLCVVLKGDFTPTDSLIIRYILILNNEGQFRSKANTHKPLGDLARPVVDDRPILQLFKEFKEDFNKRRAG